MGDIRLSLRQAINMALRQGGIQLLSDCYRFEACVRDLADMQEPATRAFIQYVDAPLLTPLIKQADNPTRESLNRVYSQTAQTLTDDRLISEGIAFEVAGALVGGFADYLNVPYEAPNLSHAPAAQATLSTSAPVTASVPASTPAPTYAIDSTTAFTSAPAPAPASPYTPTNASATGAANSTAKARRIGIPIVVGVAAGLIIAAVALVVVRFAGVGTSGSTDQKSSVGVTTDSTNKGGAGATASSSGSSQQSSDASSQQQTKKTNGVWVATKVEEWDYYSDGSDNHDVYTFGVDGSGNLTSPGVSYSCRYTDNGELMELSETNDKNTIYHTYTYDSAGRIVQERRTYSDNSCVRTYEFDEDGFVTAQHCYDDDGVFIATFKNERDSQGRVTKVTVRGVNEQTGEVKCERTEEYSYDSNNNIEKIVIEDTRYRDSGPRTITANTVRTYEYVSNPAPWLAQLQTVSKTGEPTTIF